MPNIDWDDLEWEILEGARRKVVHGEGCTLVLVELEPNGDPATHSHPHEQISCIQSGLGRFVVGDGDCDVGPGGVIVIPPGVEHAAQVPGPEPLVILDFFTPAREDFTASKRKKG